MTDELHDLLRACARAGVGLVVDGEGLRIRWCGAQDDALRARLRASRSDVIAAMRSAASGYDDPRWAVALLAHPDHWRRWMRRSAELFGGDGPPDDRAGFEVFREVMRLDRRAI